jgi:hypothetical protein
MTVESGKRVRINFEGFSGTAGFVERDGGATLSFAAALPPRLSPGATIWADCREWTVQQVSASQFVRGFKVVELRPKVA